MKTCTRCKETKELIGFETLRKAKDGKRPMCKVCRKLQRAHNRDRRILQGRERSFSLSYSGSADNKTEIAILAKKVG